MGPLLYIAITVMLASTLVKNFTLFRRYRHNKEYIECYKDLLYEKEDTYNRINNYIDAESSNEFKNKGRLLKLYCELTESKDYAGTLSELSIKDIFTDKNGVLKKDLVSFNSDSFIFVMLVLSKAYSTKNNELIETLTNKVLEISGLDDRLEIKEIVAINKAFLNKEDKGFALFNGFLDGSYTDYAYDKNMIALYKRIAISTLAFLNEPFDEFFIEDLKDFTKSLIGKAYTKNLNIYDKYFVEEKAEELEEEAEEENKEE